MSKRTTMQRVSKNFNSFVKQIQQDIASGNKSKKAPSYSDITDLLSSGLDRRDIIDAFKRNPKLRLFK